MFAQEKKHTLSLMHRHRRSTILQSPNFWDTVSMNSYESEHPICHHGAVIHFQLHITAQNQKEKGTVRWITISAPETLDRANCGENRGAGNLKESEAICWSWSRESVPRTKTRKGPGCPALPSYKTWHGYTANVYQRTRELSRGTS